MLNVKLSIDMPLPPTTFSMPMFNKWVPETMRPWIYVFFAFCFQLSGGRYFGPFNEIVSESGYMREDIQMCLYFNLAGLAFWFPMLFRTKFRYTNKTLLTLSCIAIIICNVLTMYVTSLPLLWLICFIAGVAKIQGTFECMSNIQLWIAPGRDFKIFFPVLHMIIYSAIAASTMLSSWFGCMGQWQMMHWLVIGVQCVMLLVIVCCTHHFRFMNLPMYGIDWASMGLWGAFFAQLTYLLTYGEFYNWFSSDVIWTLSGTTLATFSIILGRMVNIRHPFISASVFTNFPRVKLVYLLVVLVGGILSAEHVLEEIFLEEGLKYGTTTRSSLTWFSWGGNILGCLFALVWMKNVSSYTYVRQGIVASVVLAAYVILMYLLITPSLNIEALYLPLVCRGFAQSCFAVLFLTSLQELIVFQVFFQGLFIYQLLNMVIGGCIGSALYGYGLRYFVADALAYNPELVSHIEGGTLIAAKTIYGWLAYVALALVASFLLFDSPLRRDNPHLMQPWKFVGRQLQKRITQS